MKLSIILPSIRTHNLDRFYDSVQGSCQEYDWEIVVASPFDLPESLSNKNNVKLIKTFDKIPVCIQRATKLAEGELICHLVDDCELLPSSLDQSIDFFKDTCSKKDALCLTYVELANYMVSPERWRVKSILEGSEWAHEFQSPFINPEWFVFVQPMMLRRRFIELGGMDCQFEYSNHAHHDLAFRLQIQGGNVHVPPFMISVAAHMPERTGDHGPVHDAQTGPDQKRFNQLYQYERTPVINYNNWEECSGRWERRFGNEYLSYEEMCSQEGYSF